MENKRNKESEINCGSISAEKLRVDYERRLQPVKPVTVRLDDFKKNLNRVVADSELPPFLLELVLGEMLSAMSRVAETEREQDREAWEKTCADQEHMQDKQEQGQEKGGEVNG